VLHKTANGRQTTVPGDGGVPTSRLDMIQKPEHGVGLDIFKGQVADGLALLIGQKQVEELQRVAVGSNCMRAGSACVLQIGVEEAFGQAEKGFGF